MNERMSRTSLPQEHTAPHANGFLMLFFVLCGLIVTVACVIFGAFQLASAHYILGLLLVVGGSLANIYFWISFAGFKVLGPNQAYVFTLFGKYYGTLKESGFYHVNPFVTANAPAKHTASAEAPQSTAPNSLNITFSSSMSSNKKISLKTRTLDNHKQKVNDAMGNPVIIGSVVIGRVDDPTAAVFAVEDYEEYLSIQCDSTIRNIARLYPFDTMEDDVAEKTLRGSSSEISEAMERELSERVRGAGIVIEDVRITTLAYAEEIAAAMLQRQQAVAIIAARQKIVEGAVGMVKMAIDQLGEEDVVVLDEERKAAMVSNLLVVLCGSKDAQPIVNSGSIY